MIRTLADLADAETLTPTEASRLHGHSPQYYIDRVVAKKIIGTKDGCWSLNHESIRELFMAPKAPLSFDDHLRVAKEKIRAERDSAGGGVTPGSGEWGSRGS